MSDIAEQLLAIPGVQEGASAFSKRPALLVAGREIAHVDDDGAWDVRLTRAVINARREELLAHPCIRLRGAEKTSSSADWVWLDVRTPEDEALLLELLREAADAAR